MKVAPHKSAVIDKKKWLKISKYCFQVNPTSIPQGRCQSFTEIRSQNNSKQTKTSGSARKIPSKWKVRFAQKQRKSSLLKTSNAKDFFRRISSEDSVEDFQRCSRPRVRKIDANCSYFGVKVKVESWGSASQQTTYRTNRGSSDSVSVISAAAPAPPRKLDR